MNELEVQMIRPDEGRAGPAVVVMTRLPGTGPVKTRLAAQVGKVRAAQLAEAFLGDTLAVAAAAGWPAYLACTPLWSGEKHFLPAGFQAAFPQGDGDLGQRMLQALERLHRQGHSPLVVVGSDCPHLPLSRLGEAVRALRQVSLCLGPARDGGYYLLGLQRPVPQLLQGIPWSTPRVLANTLARARQAGLAARLLPPEFDVDTGGDLRRLARFLDQEQDLWSVCRTRAVLQAMGEIEKL